MAYKLSLTEEAAGMRANFRVYYSWRGKTYFDPMWAKTVDEAERKFMNIARELRRKVKIIRTEVVPKEDF
jgi:hypothetical protein